MEDCHRVVPHFNGDESMAYFGVYDGHGGRNIVDFIDERLEQNICTELRMTDDSNVLERLARAYLITDMQSRRCNITTSGMLTLLYSFIDHYSLYCCRSHSGVRHPQEGAERR
jgi:serine/threonine protein phosphatase PrpC